MPAATAFMMMVSVVFMCMRPIAGIVVIMSIRVCTGTICMVVMMRFFAAAVFLCRIVFLCLGMSSFPACPLLSGRSCLFIILTPQDYIRFNRLHRFFEHSFNPLMLHIYKHPFTNKIHRAFLHTLNFSYMLFNLHCTVSAIKLIQYIYAFHMLPPYLIITCVIASSV